MKIEEWIKTPECHAWLTQKLVEYDKAKLNKFKATFLEIKSKDKIDPIYFTDAYPRCGCRLEIEVLEDQCSLHVYAPNGRLLESYRPPSNEVGRYVQEWVDGIVPRIKPLSPRQDLPSPDKAG